MKAKKLTALLVCLLTAFMLMAFSASAEDVCDHKFETVKHSQTCTTEGKYVYTCALCGYSTEEKIPPHNFRYLYTREYPTCSKTGIDVYFCDWCNLIEESVVPADSNAHIYGDWTVTVEPTCSEEGEKQRVCGNKDCGYIDVASIPADESKHIPKAGTQQIVPPTCVEPGTETNVCVKCDQTYSKVIEVHSDYETNTEKYTLKEEIVATCAVPASKTYLCQCGEIFTVVGKTDPTKHDYTDESRWYYSEDASCKHPGTLKKICKNSPYHTIEEVYAPHIFEGAVMVTKAAGCKADGTLESGIKTTDCIYCDAVKTEEIPAGEHTFTDWVLSGSCSEGGTATRTCICPEKKTETITFKAGTHLNYNVIDTVKPTCINRGYQLAVCKDCDMKDPFYVLPEGFEARGYHIPGEWEVTVASSCLASGVKELHCEVCGDLVDRQVILQNNHSCIILEEGYAATCGTAGLTDLLYCVTCEQTFAQENIAATGHHFVDQFIPGEGSVRICDVCFEYEIGQVTCKCLCHNSNPIAQAIYKIITVFSKIFRINQECKCGIAHY